MPSLPQDATVKKCNPLHATRREFLRVSGGCLAHIAYRPAGAEWLARRARELTGRWPTHVVVSHYHVDHAAGLSGYTTASGQAPTVRTTAATRVQALSGTPVAPPASEELTRAYADVVLVAAESPGTIDLGNRTVRLAALRGHTSAVSAHERMYRRTAPSRIAAPGRAIVSCCRLSRVPREGQSNAASAQRKRVQSSRFRRRSASGWPASRRLSAR